MSKEQTPATAFQVCPDSDEKTALIAAFDALLDEIDDTATAGAFSTEVAAQLKSEVVDVAETTAANMRDHS